jgi:hypothetical protein
MKVYSRLMSLTALTDGTECIAPEKHAALFTKYPRSASYSVKKIDGAVTVTKWCLMAGRNDVSVANVTKKVNLIHHVEGLRS